MPDTENGERPASGEDVRHQLGDLDEAVIVEILAQRPTLAQVEAARMWIEGQGDVVDRAGRPLDGAVAAIVDIVRAEEPDEEA